MGNVIFPVQMLVYINTKVLNASLPLKVQNIYRSEFLRGEVINMKLVFIMLTDNLMEQ